jgi:hypothetical protein
MRRDSFFAEADGRSFVVFNDQPLSDDQIGPGDMVECTCKSYELASMAWSSGCNWYFVVLPEGLVLLNVYTSRGLLCKVKSRRFIKLYLDNPPHKGKVRL